MIIYDKPAVRIAGLQFVMIRYVSLLKRHKNATRNLWQLLLDKLKNLDKLDKVLDKLS